MPGRSKGRVDGGLVAMRPVITEVAGDVVVDQRPRALRASQADDRAEDLVLDLDLLGSVPRTGVVFGDHQRDRVADMADLVDGKYRVRRLVHRSAVLAVNQPAAGQAADAGRREVRTREDGEHSRIGQG